MGSQKVGNGKENFKNAPKWRKYSQLGKRHKDKGNPLVSCEEISPWIRQDPLVGRINTSSLVSHEEKEEFSPMDHT